MVPDPSVPLQVQAAVEVEEVDAESIRELVQIAAYFTVDPLDPDPQTPPIEDLTLELELHVAEGKEPQWVLFIPGAAWAAGDGGGFVVEVQEPDWQPVLQVVEDGQVRADLTEEIAALEARLAFDPNAKVWELTVEIAGVIIPIDSKPVFYPLVGASLAALEVGPDRVSAGIREGEARF